MSSPRCKHRNEESCQCGCHHNENSYEEEGIDIGYEDQYAKENIKRIYSQKSGKGYETANISLMSTNGLENTMSSFGNKLRQQPRSTKDVMHNRDFEDEIGDENMEENRNHNQYLQERDYDMRDSLTYQMKSADHDHDHDHDHDYDQYQYQYDQSNQYENEIEDDKQRFDYEQLASDFRNLQWENDNLTNNLKTALKEKSAAIAMSNSLKRILDDYSNKTNLKGASEALKSLCIDENNHLRETANAYEALMNHSFDFLRYLSSKQGIEMRPHQFYLNNEDNFSNLLDTIHQSIQSNGNKNNQFKQIKEFNSKGSIHSYEDDGKEKQFQQQQNCDSNEEAYKTGKFPSNRSNMRDDGNQHQHQQLYYENSNKNVSKQAFNINRDKEKQRDMNYHDMNMSHSTINNSNYDNEDQEQSYQRHKSNINIEDQMQNSYKEKRSNEDQPQSYHRQKSNIGDQMQNSDKDKRTNEDQSQSYQRQKSINEDQMRNSYKEKRTNEDQPQSYHRQKRDDKDSQIIDENMEEENDLPKKKPKAKEVLSNGKHDDSNDSKKGSSVLKRANVMQDPETIPFPSVNYDPPLSNNKKLKGKTVISKPNLKSSPSNLKSPNVVNLNSFDKSSSQSIKGHKPKFQPNYPSITEDSNSNAYTNESPNLYNNNNSTNLKSIKAQNQELTTLDLKKFRSRFNISKTKPDSKDNINKDKSNEIESDSKNKRSDSLKPGDHESKTKSGVGVKMDCDPKESTSSSPAKLRAIQKAKTFFNKQRIQSPLRQDVCTACSVDCNISANGYSPMTFIPYGGKIRRKAVTPVVFPL